MSLVVNGIVNLGLNQKRRIKNRVILMYTKKKGKIFLTEGGDSRHDVFPFPERNQVTT